MARCVNIQGTMSDVGKSVITAGLCRVFMQDGYKSAPFKSQNMALNSFATADGYEIGRAQAMQAQAAGEEPDVRMNPVLLKPTDDKGSQVVVMGRVRANMRADEYFSYRKSLLPEIKSAYESLSNEYDIIVTEGAGSPVELNLLENDIVNMGLARLINSPVLLCADIDRGGVFAQLYGTLKLLGEDRHRVEGLIVNKFRGDIRLFEDGVNILEEKCKSRVLGVVPYINDLRVDGEDSLSFAELLNAAKKTSDRQGGCVAIISLPHISNYTDFAPLVYEGDKRVVFARDPKELSDADMIIIPGTKNTMEDLSYLRKKGFEDAIMEASNQKKTILGICGGYQMLGESIEDNEGIEGRRYHEKGLGLLPVKTSFTREKRIRQSQANVTAKPFEGIKNYTFEIHNGRSTRDEEHTSYFARLDDGSTDGCIKDNVYGTYLHGLFDKANYKEDEYDRLADVIREALDIKKIYGIMERWL